MALFEIDPLDRMPIYEQLKRQIRLYISIGRLKPEDKLPSVRQLATELGVNPNTIHKVYRELELADVIKTLPARGTFIKQLPEATEKDYQNWTDKCKDLVSAAVAKSLDKERCRQIFEKQAADLWPIKEEK